MQQNLILAGVGGQGILTIARAISFAAMRRNLVLKQAEVHGMSQRGGAVQSHLRLSRERIWSDLIPRGEADLVLSVEPLEALRYLDFLRPDGMIITSRIPFVNIPDYPEMGSVLAEIEAIPRHLVIDSESLAKEAGSSRTQNMVMLGAASGYLQVKEASLTKFIPVLFARHGEKVVASNLKAFALGKAAAAVPSDPAPGGKKRAGR